MSAQIHFHPLFPYLYQCIFYFVKLICKIYNVEKLFKCVCILTNLKI